MNVTNFDKTEPAGSFIGNEKKTEESLIVGNTDQEINKKVFDSARRMTAMEVMSMNRAARRRMGRQVGMKIPGIDLFKKVEKTKVISTDTIDK